MGIKFCDTTNRWIAFYSKRHPVTRLPISRRRVGIESKSAALKVERELVLVVEKLIHAQVVPCWQETVRRYISHLSQQDISGKTVENYRLCLEAHTFEDWGLKLIDQIAAIDIRNLISTKLANKSESHKKNLLKYIRGVFNFAVESNLILRNPTPKMKFRIGDKVTGVLTEAQVALFLSTARQVDSEWFPVWATAIYTGMRNGELYALTWENVDLERRLLKVVSSWNNVDGFKSTKSEDERQVEIAEELVPILRNQKKQHPESHFVLPRIDKWEKGEQARELRAFLMVLGLPRIRFHDLRATCATILLAKGVPALKVQIGLGWKDIKTMSLYIRKAGVSVTGMTSDLKFNL